MKLCTSCNEEKEYIKFYKSKKSKDGMFSTCKECDKKRCKKYCKDNKDKIVKIQSKYSRSQKNKDRVNSYRSTDEGKRKRKEYYCKKGKETKRIWREGNRAKLTACQAKRRTCKINATPDWANLEKIEVLYEKCIWLGSLTGLRYHVDHITPLQGDNVCGLHVWENLQILEASLNISKSNKINHHRKERSNGN